MNREGTKNTKTTVDGRGSIPVRVQALFFAVAISTTCPLEAVDCNQNGVVDASDITSGWSVDCNDNEVPDECETAPLRFAAVLDREIELETQPRGGALFDDFNGDGQTDLVLGTRAALNSFVAVFLNRGDGTLGEPHQFGAGRSLASMAAGDIDGDGDVDLVTANFSRLQYVQNLGDGTFAEPMEISVPSGTRFVAAVDLTRDELPELLAASTTDDAVVVLRNEGAGVFAEGVSYTVGVDPVAVVALDVDGDGDLDLATANSGEPTMSVLLADGQGGFSPAQAHTVPEGLSSVAAGDVDGDGDEDVVAFADSGVTVFEHLRAGVLQSVSYPARITSPQLIDLEGDGDLDVFFFDVEVSAAAAMVNLGAGRFAPAATLAAVTRSDWAIAGDLDDDGDVEFAVVKSLARSFALFYGGERGDLTVTAKAFPLAQRPHGGVLADFNGDGHLDVVSSNGHQQSISVILGVGDGTFGLPRAFEVPGAIVHHQFFWPRAGDFDLDGDLDVVVSDDDSSYLIVIFNLGDGVFGNEVPYDAGFRTTSVAVADVNDDGYPDLLGTTTADNVGVLLNARDATFLPAEGIPVGSGPGAIETGDWDGDGKVDLAVANVSSQDVSVVLKRADGFVEVERLPVSGRPQLVVPGRFDGDAFVDLAAIAGETVTVFFGTGSGTFPRSASFDAGVPGGALTTADLNGDGLQDIVTAGGASPRVAVLFGGGDGTFEAPLYFDVGVEPRFVVAGDLDEDGDTDLISGNRVTQNVTVLLNQSGTSVLSANFLEAVCTEREFVRLARGAASRLLKETLDYITPAKANDALLPTVFVNSLRFFSHKEFLSEALPERFEALTQDEFESRFVKRAQREYFAGSIGRLRVEEGGFAYAVSLLVDPAETPTLVEVRDLLERLSIEFHLAPLGFFAETAAQREAASTWVEAGFPIFFGDESAGPDVVQDAFPTFTLEIPVGMTACGTFALAGADRGALEEYENKSRVQFSAGSIELPTIDETFEATIVDELVYGAERQVAESQGPGSFRVRRVAGADDITHYRFTYQQDFALRSGERLSFAWVSPITYQARGLEPILATQILDETLLVAPPGGEAFQLRVDDVLLVRYGSCSYESLPEWEVSATLDDGTTWLLEERWRPALAVDASGPASLIRGEVVLGGESIVVEDYWRLVYSAFRHNAGVRHWIVFERPRSLPGLDDLVYAVELVGPNEFFETTESARYLGPDFETVASPGVVSYQRASVDRTLLFRRGDVGGDGRLDLTDALQLLRYLFRRDTEISCRKAADINDDGCVNVVDAVGLARHLFAEPLTPALLSGCGLDRTPDSLSCGSYAACQ